MLRRVLETLTHPRVLIPVLISAALLTFVLTVSDASAVMEQISGIPLGVMLLSLGLAFVYLILKGLLWRYFMETIQIPFTWKQLTLAFAVGEIAVSLPAGIYAQNYVLRRVAGADFSRSSAATTALLAGEATVSLVVLAALGIPGWDWLRPAVLGLLAVLAGTVGVLLCSPPIRGLARRLVEAVPLGAVGPEFLEMVESARLLITPRVVFHSAPVIVAYLFALVLAFYLVARSVGVASFTLLQAVTVYLFGLAIVLVSPITSHLGVVEAGGLGAMHAWGYSSTEGIAALLGFRLVWTGAIWLVCIPVVAILHREFTEAGKGGF